MTSPQLDAVFTHAKWVCCHGCDKKYSSMLGWCVRKHLAPRENHPAHIPLPIFLKQATKRTEMEEEKRKIKHTAGRLSVAAPFFGFNFMLKVID